MDQTRLDGEGMGETVGIQICIRARCHRSFNSFNKVCTNTIHLVLLHISDRHEDLMRVYEVMRRY